MFQTTMRLDQDDEGVGVALVHEQLGERLYTIVRRVSDDSETMDVVRLDVTTVCVRACVCVLLCAHTICSELIEQDCHPRDTSYGSRQGTYN